MPAPRLVFVGLIVYIILWQMNELRVVREKERFSEIQDKVHRVTETIASTFSKSFEQIVKLKKDIVLKLTGTGKLHVKVR